MPEERKCKDYRDMLSGKIDGELHGDLDRELSAHLEECEGCRGEHAELVRIKEVMTGMKFNEPEDKIWENYWAGVYNRLERNLGWILLSIGIISTLVYAMSQLWSEFLHDQSLPLYFRVGVLALVAGAIVLLVSIGRERLKAIRTDRYREVKR